MDTTEVAAAAAQVANTQPPAIGDYWPGQGGIYIGQAVEDENYPQGHLVLCEATTEDSLTWKAAIAWAEAQTVDGHTDFRLPTRFESALIYANGQKHVDQDRWHWTLTPRGSVAWVQYFGDGGQGWGYVNDKYCARAVRRFVL
ncbi:MAG: hypothetical protein PVS3B2_00050 [Candidatus Dormibacteraceae bacterium]